MTIILRQSKSEMNVVTKDITDLATVTGTLRGGCSVQDPVITVESPMDNIVWCNYLWIEEFGRHYFVTNIESVSNGLWNLYCHVDVLSTYASYLFNLRGIVARSENLYNLYLDDDKFLVTSKRIYTTLDFPNKVTAANTEGSRSFVVTIAGGEPASSSS